MADGVAISELTEALFDELSASEDRMLGNLEMIAYLENPRRRGIARPDPDGRWYPAASERPPVETGADALAR